MNLSELYSPTDASKSIPRLHTLAPLARVSDQRIVIRKGTRISYRVEGDSINLVNGEPPKNPSDVCSYAHPFQDIMQENGINLVSSVHAVRGRTSEETVVAMKERVGELSSSEERPLVGFGLVGNDARYLVPSEDDVQHMMALGNSRVKVLLAEMLRSFGPYGKMMRRYANNLHILIRMVNEISETRQKNKLDGVAGVILFEPPDWSYVEAVQVFPKNGGDPVKVDVKGNRFHQKVAKIISHDYSRTIRRVAGRARRWSSVPIVTQSLLGLEHCLNRDEHLNPLGHLAMARMAELIIQVEKPNRKYSLFRSPLQSNHS